ncbi:MAG: hypothetical protein Q8Q29_10045 [Actinomycetota bacterium]|nr:hypothetical protein [Actinomycetota bacterium]
MRRRRRRRTIIVIVVVGAIIATAYGVTRALGEAEVTRAYLDIAYEVASGQALAADSLGEMVTEIEQFTRPRMLQTLEEMESRSDELATLLAAADPPPDLERADLWLQIAITAWRNGLSEARAGLLALASNPVDSDGAAALQRGLVDLRVGDRAYHGFMSEIADVDTTLLGGPFPSIAFVPTTSENLFDPVDLARRMFLTPELASVDDLAVADIRLEPSPVGVSGGLPVVPVSSSQSLGVTINNRGNESRTGIVVTLQLVSNDGEEYSATQEIESLEGGAARSLTFADLPVKPGTRYQVTVSIPSDDDEADNDSTTFRFAVNEDA